MKIPQFLLFLFLSLFEFEILGFYIDISIYALLHTKSSELSLIFVSGKLPKKFRVVMVRPVKREVGSTSSSSIAEASGSHGQTDRRVLRSRYLAVKTLINGVFF